MIAATTGSLAALFIMGLGPAFARAPHFWGIALAVALAGAILVLISTAVADDSLSPAPAFVCAGTVLMWWIATNSTTMLPPARGRTRSRPSARRLRRLRLRRGQALSAA